MFINLILILPNKSNDLNIGGFLFTASFSLLSLFFCCMSTIIYPTNLNNNKHYIYASLSFIMGFVGGIPNTNTIEYNNKSNTIEYNNKSHELIWFSIPILLYYIFVFYRKKCYLYTFETIIFLFIGLVSANKININRI